MGFEYRAERVLRLPLPALTREVSYHAHGARAARKVEIAPSTTGRKRKRDSSALSSDLRVLCYIIIPGAYGPSFRGQPTVSHWAMR